MEHSDIEFDDEDFEHEHQLKTKHIVVKIKYLNNLWNTLK